MNETEEGRLEDRYCEHCDDETLQEYLGMLPNTILDERDHHLWSRTWICVQCSSLIKESIEKEEMEEAEEKVILSMVEHGHLSEEDAEDILN